MIVQAPTPRTGDILPAFKQPDGKLRFLGVIHTSRPKMAIAPFSAAGVPVFDLSTLEPYDRYQANVPILDQGQLGACVGHGSCTAIMKARDLGGQTFVALSADSLYAQINGGRDGGADPADAMTALETNGICTLKDVPDEWVLWSQVSAKAKATALRFRIPAVAVYGLSTFAELVTADKLGFATVLCVNVGGNFDPGPSGLVGFTPGEPNHCVSGGEAFDRVGGQAAYRFRNSWTTQWGKNGCAWLTARHIDQQPNFAGFAIRFALTDPLDPGNPPLLTKA